MTRAVDSPLSGRIEEERHSSATIPRQQLASVDCASIETSVVVGPVPSFGSCRTSKEEEGDKRKLEKRRRLEYQDGKGKNTTPVIQQYYG